MKASVRHKFDFSPCFSVSVLIHQEQTKGGLILKGLFGTLEFFQKKERMNFFHMPVIKKQAWKGFRPPSAM